MSYIEPLDKQQKTCRYIKYNLYFYSSTATFMWSRNTAWETSYISFFCGRDPFCEVVRRSENTHGGADRSAWVTSGSLPSVQNYRPYIVFQLPWTRLFAHVFFCLWLVIVTYILPFFRVICWSYLRTDISVILSTGNKLHSCHHPLFLFFLWNHFVDVILRLHWIC